MAKEMAMWHTLPIEVSDDQTIVLVSSMTLFRSIYTSFQLILHLISEMLVSLVVSLADQLSLGQFNIEVHAEEQSFGELF